MESGQLSVLHSPSWAEPGSQWAVKDRCWVRILECSWQTPHIPPAASHPPLQPEHQHTQVISHYCCTVNGKKEPEGEADLESDLLRHSLCLVGQHHGITVTPAFLARVLPQLKFLRERKESSHTRTGKVVIHGSGLVLFLLLPVSCPFQARLSPPLSSG